MTHCIEICNACHQICVETLDHCKEAGAGTPSLLGALQGCADICKSTAQMIRSGSSFFSLSCGICAEVCRHCLAECEASQFNTPLIEQCMKLCLECAETCEKLLFVHQGGFSAE